MDSGDGCVIASTTWRLGVLQDEAILVLYLNKLHTSDISQAVLLGFAGEILLRLWQILHICLPGRQQELRLRVKASRQWVPLVYPEQG